MSDNTARNEEPKTCPVDHTKLSNKDTEKQACPVNHTALTKDEPQKCPVDHTKPATPNSTEKATCPVDPSTYKHFIPPTSNDAEPQSCPVDPSTYKHFVPPQEQKPVKQGCDSNAMDNTNNMPKVSEQFIQQDQRMQLGLGRETSTIPRAESQDKLWVYPSEQMFFNAMKRKNWDAKEEDMAVVVPIHNAVNEMAWKKILEWEKMHQTDCNQPMLLKFEGKPKDYSPKARLRNFFGYALPFDRHDWVVDRCGEKVTYVIDFYSGKQDPNRPMSLSFYLDVRPAVTPAGIWDRLKMSFQKGQFM